MSKAAAAPESDAPKSKFWPRVLLALWFAWLLAMVLMSWSEWDSPRPLPKSAVPPKLDVR